MSNLTPPVGYYQRTCRNLSFTQTTSNPDAWQLTGECQKRDGSWVSASFNYNINNCNGVLTWDPDNTICPD